MSKNIHKELEEIKTLLRDIHKLHLGDQPQPAQENYKSKLKAEILLKVGKRQI